VPRLLAVSVTARTEGKRRGMDGSKGRPHRGEQRESPRAGGGNESGEGSRLSARALSSSTPSRRTRDYSSIDEPLSSPAQLTSISADFFSSTAATFLSLSLSFRGALGFFVAAPSCPALRPLRDGPPVRTGRVTCRLSSDSFVVITAGALNPRWTRESPRTSRVLSIPESPLRETQARRPNYTRRISRLDVQGFLISSF